MYPLNPLFAIVIFGVAYLTAYLIQLKYKNVVTSGRYETIDGLRGFLAIGVFIHHSSIWYQLIQTGNWELPDSNFYSQLGQTSVALFFMITSFLFITKLINTGEKFFNWKHFFVSRIFRLAPMYYFSLTIIIIYVMFISNWKLNVPAIEWIQSIAQWLLFTTIDMPLINNVGITSLINASVSWSLSFEWLFYFSMPLLGLFILKVKPPAFYLIAALVVSAIIIKSHNISSLHHVVSFAGGAIAPFLIKYSAVNKKAKSIVFSMLIILCIVLLGQFHTSESVLCKILIAVAFTCIALGNDIFGILKKPVFKFLGEISYSTYLLHGILLFTVFHFGFGMEKSKMLSPTQFYGLIFLITPVLVLISFLGFNYIEKPFINLSKRIN